MDATQLLLIYIAAVALVTLVVVIRRSMKARERRTARNEAERLSRSRSSFLRMEEDRPPESGPREPGT